MAQNPNPEYRYENFGEFFGRWMIRQENDLRELATAIRAYNRAPQQVELIEATKEVADRVLSHYEHYYKVKEESTHGYVYQMLNPWWLSTMEEAYMWIGGWRPTMLFHVVYTKIGLQLEGRLMRLLDGIEIDDLSTLSVFQTDSVDELQQETVDAEKLLTEKWANFQGTVGNRQMVELSNLISESLMPQLMDQQLDDVLSVKENGFEELLKEADKLRLTTLKRLVAILSPIQTIHFFISVAQLHLQLHDWGKKKDIEQDQPLAEDHTVPIVADPGRARPSCLPTNP